MLATRIIFITLCFSFYTRSHGMFTPLEIDNHPCQPENLKRAISYICNTNGDIICQNGWMEPVDTDDRDPLSPCSEPICTNGCEHGTCVSPDWCACKVGWEGVTCDICIPMPGCKHGHCITALECHCDDGWGGGKCDIPACMGCSNGYCAAPNDCMCFDGWSSDNCTVCMPAAGCLHGSCGDTPLTCQCDDGWEGALCDMPVCEPACVNGICAIMEGAENCCICETGWQSASCDTCAPYWDCPNQGVDACQLPNECRCSQNETDPKGLCNNPQLIKLP